MAEVRDDNESLRPEPHTSSPPEFRQPALRDGAAMHEIEFCFDLLNAACSTPDEVRRTRALLLQWRRLGYPSLESLRAQSSSASEEPFPAAEYPPRSSPPSVNPENAESKDFEKEHFYRCGTCGKLVDKRSLDEVVFHNTDHKPRPDIPYRGWKRIE